MKKKDRLIYKKFNQPCEVMAQIRSLETKTVYVEIYNCATGEIGCYNADYVAAYFHIVDEGNTQ